MTRDEAPSIDYSSLGTSLDDLFAPVETEWTPELRAFEAEAAAHFRFATRLMELRKSLGLTQAEAGEVIGEAQSEVSRLERGKVTPGVDRAAGILARLRAYKDAHAPERPKPTRTLRAIQVARYLLSHQDREDAISNLKLQKLLYFAQGTFLAQFGQPLFSDQLRAWKDGPVVPAVWREYAEYKAAPIARPKDFDDAEIEPVTREVLSAVYREWGVYTAWALRMQTHTEGPWKTTPQQAVIAQDEIALYFTGGPGRPAIT
jgi:uncharacterized phage-associated protein